MNTILNAPRPPRASNARLLAIEPDSVRAGVLRDLVGAHVGADCTVVKDALHAISAIEARVPDVVLTSMLLPPRQAEELIEGLRRLSGAGHVPVITIPYFIDSDPVTTVPPSKVLNFIKRRRVVRPPICPPVLVAEQINAYLEQAREKQRRSPATPRFVSAAKPGSTPLEPGSPVRRPASVHQIGRPYANDRRQLRRRAAAEVPWLWRIQLLSGTDLRLVDISTGGALLESTAKIAPGTALDLRVIGKDINVRVSARMLRTDVAGVDGSGVRYRMAAAFVSPLGIRRLEAPDAPATVTATAIAELLARVLREGDRTSGAALRTKFELGLRGLLPVQDALIRRTPILAAEGSESVYFKVPVAAGSQPILQAVFEPNYQPTADEFKVLKAAANLAAVLLESAPLSDQPAN